MESVSKSWNKTKFVKEKMQVEKLKNYLAKCYNDFGPLEDLIPEQVVVIDNVEQKLKKAEEKLVNNSLFPTVSRGLTVQHMIVMWLICCFRPR